MRLVHRTVDICICFSESPCLCVSHPRYGHLYVLSTSGTHWWDEETLRHGDSEKIEEVTVWLVLMRGPPR